MANSNIKKPLNVTTYNILRKVTVNTDNGYSAAIPYSDFGNDIVYSNIVGCILTGWEANAILVAQVHDSGLYIYSTKAFNNKNVYIRLVTKWGGVKRYLCELLAGVRHDECDSKKPTIIRKAYPIDGKRNFQIGEADLRKASRTLFHRRKSRTIGGSDNNTRNNPTWRRELVGNSRWLECHYSIPCMERTAYADFRGPVRDLTRLGVVA